MDTPKFWWQVKLPQHDPILVTMREAAAIKEALRNGAAHIEIKSESYPTALMEVTQSDKLITENDDRNLLEAGRTGTKPEVMVHPDTGSVMWKWAKKWVSGKQYENFYSKSNAYFRLDSRPQAVLVAFKQPLYTNQRLRDELYWCEGDEIARLDRWADTSPRGVAA